jgi:hypothetical protein
MIIGYRNYQNTLLITGTSFQFYRLRGQVVSTYIRYAYDVGYITSYWLRTTGLQFSADTQIFV